MALLVTNIEKGKLQIVASELSRHSITMTATTFPATQTPTREGKAGCVREQGKERHER